jgi:hypothetical protein
MDEASKNPRHSRWAWAGLPPYDLTQATYTSDYLSLRHTEVATVDGEPLEKLGSFEEGLVNGYDKLGAVPFLFASGPSGRYTVELAYSPGLAARPTRSPP